MVELPSCDGVDDSANLAAFRTDKTEPVTSRISILPKRRLLATAVALIVSSASAMDLMAQSAPQPTAPGKATEVAPVETCALGSFVCPPRPVQYNQCRPNAMLSFYDPDITKDTTLRDTATTDIVSNLQGTSGVKVESPEPDIYHLTSRVRMVRADQVLQADDVTYNADSTAYDARGTVQYQEAGMLLSADRITGTTTPNQGDADKVRYQLLQSRGNGVAARAKILDPQHGHFNMATYSTCDVGSHMWEFRAKTMNLNKETGVGKAHSATMRFENVPFMYLPFFTFPLDDRRKSGFLAPTFGSTSHSGAFLSAPLLPEPGAKLRRHDRAAATTPSVARCSAGEFRYLLPRSNGSSTSTTCPMTRDTDDDISNTTTATASNATCCSSPTRRAWGRLQFQHQHQSRVGQELPARLQQRPVQLGCRSSLVQCLCARRRQLVERLARRGQLPERRRLPANYVEPYKRWPRATFNLDVPVTDWLDSGMDNEAVSFRKTDGPVSHHPGQVDGPPRSLSLRRRRLPGCGMVRAAQAWRTATPPIA